MRKKKISLVVEQNTEDSGDAEWLGYKVKEVRNSTDWDIGEILTKERLDIIIDNRVRPVEVKIV